MQIMKGKIVEYLAIIDSDKENYWIEHHNDASKAQAQLECRWSLYSCATTSFENAIDFISNNDNVKHWRG